MLLMNNLITPGSRTNIMDAITTTIHPRITHPLRSRIRHVTNAKRNNRLIIISTIQLINSAQTITLPHRKITHNSRNFNRFHMHHIRYAILLHLLPIATIRRRLSQRPATMNTRRHISSKISQLSRRMQRSSQFTNKHTISRTRRHINSKGIHDTKRQMIRRRLLTNSRHKKKLKH